MSSQNDTARVVRFHEIGTAEVLKIEQEAVPEPNANEVRIQVKAIGLNRAEVMFRSGAYLEAPVFPSRLGYEASGLVDKVGAGVTDFKAGDAVSSIPAFSMGQYGVYGDYAIVPTYALTKNPSNFSHQQSASIWMQYITAYGAIVKLGQVKTGDNVVVTAASSSVGVAAIQIAKHLGATVFATSRGDSKKAFLLEQGADHFIDTQQEDWANQVMQLTGDKGINLSFDPIGGPIINQLAEASAAGGMIIEYGALSPEASPFPLFAALAKGLTLRGYTLFELTQNPEVLSEAVEFLKGKFESGALTPVLDKQFDLADIVQAHQYMESNVQKGKIVVNV